MKFATKAGALALALMLPLTACDDESVAGAEGSGGVTILLTDAPADIEAAIVTISQIYLAGEGGEAEGEASGRVVLRSEPVTTDLLTLQNDIKTLVEDKAVPAGNYGQLRFVITGAAMLLDQDGDDATDEDKVVLATSADYAGLAQLPEGFRTRDAELKCPSCAQSGFKVILPGGGLQVEEGQEAQILVDFDVQQSFIHQAGRSGMWILRPTLKATSVSAAAQIRVNTTLASGVTLPAVGGEAITLANFKARMTNAAGSSEEVALTDANSDGTFEAMFKFVVPSAGPFKVELVAPTGLTITTTPAGAQTVTPTAGAVSTVTFQVATAVVAGG